MILIGNLISVSTVLACECNRPAICQAYSRAKSVFIGKVEKIESNKNEPLSPIKVTFSVEKTFKGQTEKIETAKFGYGDCETSFKVGEAYFVYKEEPVRPCNRTDLLSVSGSDLEYAKNLSENNPIFSITGVFWELSKDEAKNIQVTVEKGQTKYKPDINDYGTFEFKATDKGVYRINIVIPFEAQISLSQFKDSKILPDNSKFSSNSSQTTLEYEVEFKPNECDFKLFYISKVTKSNSSLIEMNISDKIGISTPLTFPFQNTRNQSLSNTVLNCRRNWI